MLIPVDREVFLPIVLWSLLLGFFFGAIYDIFRIRRIFVSTGGFKRKYYKSRAVAFIKKNAEIFDLILIFIEDIVFSLFCTVSLILLNFKLYFGLPRWYSAAFALCGFFLYRVTVGRLVIASCELIFKAVSAVLGFVVKYFIKPIASGLNRLIKALYNSIYKEHLKKLTCDRERKMLDKLSRLCCDNTEKGCKTEDIK